MRKSPSPGKVQPLGTIWPCEVHHINTQGDLFWKDYTPLGAREIDRIVKTGRNINGEYTKFLSGKLSVRIPMSHFAEAMRSLPRSNSVPSPEGTKFDSGKLRWDLIPFDCLEEVVDIYGRGAEVHGDDNWKSVDRGPERYFAALMRHLAAYRRGEEFDEAWHTRHLAHVVWNALALLWFQTHPRPEEKTKK